MVSSPPRASLSLAQYPCLTHKSPTLFLPNQLSSQHQVPKTWVKQHPKNNTNPHKQTKKSSQDSTYGMDDHAKEYHAWHTTPPMFGS